MRVRVLGCSGGIGGRLRTTSFLLDDDILMDAGTGVGDLTLDELARIDHVFLTHSHLDHVACLPLMVDSVGSLRERVLTVHSTPATIDILREHLFNWKLWPDFTQIPTVDAPYMVYRSLPVGGEWRDGARRIVSIPANHTVPATGFLLEGGEASLLFSGDTYVNPAFWQLANSVANLRYVIIETAFPDEEEDLARRSKHLAPTLLAEGLATLERPVEILITHLKPAADEQTMREVLAVAGKHRVRMLEVGQTFEI